jgi:hypothetical protein
MSDQNNKKIPLRGPLTLAASIIAGLGLFWSNQVAKGPLPDLTSPIMATANIEPYQALLDAGHISPEILESYFYGKMLDDLMQERFPLEKAQELLKSIDIQLAQKSRRMGVLEIADLSNSPFVLWNETVNALNAPFAELDPKAIQENLQKIADGRHELEHAVEDEGRIRPVLAALLNSKKPSPQELEVLNQQYEMAKYYLLLAGASNAGRPIQLISLEPTQEISGELAALKKMFDLNPEEFWPQFLTLPPATDANGDFITFKATIEGSLPDEPGRITATRYLATDPSSEMIILHEALHTRPTFKEKVQRGGEEERSR